MTRSELKGIIKEEIKNVLLKEDVKITKQYSPEFNHITLVDSETEDNGGWHQIDDILNEVKELTRYLLKQKAKKADVVREYGSSFGSSRLESGITYDGMTGYERDTKQK